MPRTKGKKKEGGERRSGRFIIPAGEVNYEPPEEYPDDAKSYLSYLSRTRQVMASLTLAHLDHRKPTFWRADPDEGGLEGFAEEEERAKRAFAEWQEGAFFNLAQSESGMPAVTAGIFTLKSLMPDTYGEKKELNHKGKLDVGWLDVLNEDDD